MLKKAVALCLGAALITITTFVMVSKAPADPPGNPHVPDEVIIKFKDNASNQDKDQIRAELGGYKVKGWGRIKAELRKLDPDLTVEEAISRYKNHPKVQYIEPNYIVTAEEIPNDPRFGELWGMQNTGQTGGTAGADIMATSAWDVFTGSSSVLIGVIDTGVDYTHPDLAANIYTNPGEIPNNGIDDDNNGYIDDVHGWDFANDDNDPMDDHGHGSHVSGTIGGVGNNGIGVTGVCWNVKILPLKFLSAGGSGSTADAVDAVNYATMMGVNLTSNSWGGGGFSQALYDAIADANAAGQLFVAASGNSGANTDVGAHYPSAYDLPNIVAVAATDHNDQLASFSNYGATTVDLAAPGVDILSTFPGNSYGSISGTSMATPHVSGALGLVFGRFPAIGHLDAKNLLLNFVDPLPNLSGVVLTGGRLNAFFPIAEPDSIPPGAITDLAAIEAGSNWLRVAWTAPGDDGYDGTASRYVVKVSTAPINDGNWDAATAVPNPPDPDPVGSPQDMKVPGLDFDTTYYVAVKALDEFGNASDVSNNASGTTLGVPDIASSPLTMSETLLSGATSNQTLTLSNVGFGTLDFEIPVPDLVTTIPVVAAFVEYGKGELDPRTGDPVIEGLGGPDGFGYRWVDSDEAFGPAFAWTDISGTGTLAMSSGDDANTGPYPIGFPFSFYGVEYNSFRICSNGFMSLSSTSTAYSNQPLPNGGAPANLIAPFWDDLDLSTTGDVYYESDGSSLIVQWTAVPHYSSGGPYTFQAILNVDGSIEFQYLSIGSPDNSATVGIQNATGTDGLQIAYNTNYLHDNLAVRIIQVPQWVTVTPTSGTIYAPNSQNLNVNFNSAGLLGGVYEGNIRIVSNDPDESPYTVPVELTVIGAPDIAVSPASFDFGDVFIGATPTTEILVQNPGTDVLTVSSISVDNAAYGVDVTSFTVPAKSSQVVTVTFAPGAPQSYPATMTIQSDDPDEPTVNVPLTGVGLVPPDFSVSPTSLISNLLTGQTQNQTLTFTNSGGADFEFDLSVDFHAEVTVHNDVVEVGKDEVDANAGQPVTEGSGGPDLYGYRWIDSDEPGGPTYDWIDISGTGTPVFSGANDDRNVGPFPIGFSFPFYGNDFTEFRICSNGWISFTSTSTDLSNAPLPGTGAPENLLAMFHDDLRPDTATGGNVFYEYDGARLIVQFNNVLRYSSGGPYTFQALLYPDGTIVYQYADMQGTRLDEATIGIQNSTQDDGLTVVYNADYVHDGLAIRFQAFPEWLTVTPASGVIPPGGSLPVTARFNSNGLYGGTYGADIMVASNDPVQPSLAIPATMNVTGAPDIVVTPLAIDYGDVYLGTPTLRNLVISNVGTDQLILTGWALNNPDFGTDLTVPEFLGPTQSLIVTMRFTPSVVGPRTGSFTIASNDPDQPNVTVDLSGNGLLPPDATITPASLAASLFTGESEVQQVHISNSGASDLNWTASTLLGASEVVVYSDDVDLAKEEADPRPGILGSGGPDLYGYRWKDSDESGGPAFEWTDISGTGTPVFSGIADDSNQGPFDIGFAFPFYGTAFSSFRISSNGFITFTSTSSDLSNAPLPGTGAPENLLAIFHDDLRIDTSTGANVYYEYDGSKLIVQFDQVYKYYANGSLTFQAHLYPNGTIMYYYLAMTGADLTSATVGIQNDARDDGLTVVYNDAYVHDNLAIRIAPVSDWLTVNPAAGTVPPGGSQDVNVTFNAADLFGGLYEGAVRFETNDPGAGVVDVTATLDVTGVPLLAIDPAALDFGDVFIGYSASLEMIATNVGTDELTVTGMTSSLGDYHASPEVFTLAPFESQVVTMTFSPTDAGMRSATMAIASNDASSPTICVLEGVGVVPPVAEISPTTVVGAAMPGGSKTKTLTLCNTGGSDLFWTAGAMEATAAVVYTDVTLPKALDEPGATVPEDTRPGILGAGGPDTFGYSWTDSDEPGGPTFDWTDISGTGTAIFGQYEDDDNYGPIPIGFDFSFYGNTFSELNVCSNGWLSFTNSSLHSYSNQPLPNSGSSVPENLLAPFWDDMVVDPITRGLDVYYEYDGTKLTVQFEIRRIAAFDPPYYTFQVILYPNGDIVYQYNTLGSTTNSCTIGIQNETKDDGLTVVYNDAYVHEGLAILFSSGAQWLSVSPESGVIPAGECVDLAVMMNAAELEAGDYYGNVNISSNDPANPTVSADVVFHVGTVDAADCDMDPNTINLGANGAYVTAYVELPGGYDPNDVVVETVRLNGTVPADLSKSNMGDFNMNGVPDWTFKFDRAAVKAILPEGESVEVTVTGEIMDTIYFVCTDYVRVINPTLNAPNGGESLLAGSAYEIRWTNPRGWEVTGATIAYSPDGGQTWSLVAENVTGTSYVWSVPAEATQDAKVRVYVADAIGVMGSDSSDQPFSITTSVTGITGVTPTVYALAQNAPNPFRGATHITYDLPQESRIELKIFDVGGRMVRVLENATIPAGRYEVSWDGRDDSGRNLASGIYFYRLETDRFSATKRMFLLK